MVGSGFGSPPFRLSAERLNGFVRLVASGELDLSTAEELDRSLERLQRDRATIIVDLSGLGFMGVAGVQAFADASRRARSTGGSVLIVNCPASARRVFDLTSTSELLDGQAVSGLFDDDRRWIPFDLTAAAGPPAMEDR
jgi:anti-sigma B factor antagonist